MNETIQAMQQNHNDFSEHVAGDALMALLKCYGSSLNQEDVAKVVGYINEAAKKLPANLGEAIRKQG